MLVTSRRFAHASMNLKKVLSWKTRQVYFIYPLPCRLKLCQFFFTWADILSEKNPYSGKHLFCKTRTDYAHKLRLQDFATGKNLSFNHRSKQESFAFFLGKLFYKSNRKLFSCVCISWYKHSRGWENSRQLFKPSSRVCITVSNCPNRYRVYIRLCKNGKRFLLLLKLQLKISPLVSTIILRISTWSCPCPLGC